LRPAPTAEILTTSPPKSSTKSWAAAFLPPRAGHPHCLGLAYLRAAASAPRLTTPARFVLGTKSESTVQAVQAVLTSTICKSITDDEIKRAKDSILNSFIFNLIRPTRFCTSAWPTSSTAIP
jgi:hypothetical protein